MNEQKEANGDMTALTEKIDQLVTMQTKLEVSISRLEASMMPRHEIAAAIETRVLTSVYAVDKIAMERDINELKGRPQATWVKTGILVSSVVGCLGAFIASAGVILSIVALAATHVIFK